MNNKIILILLFFLFFSFSSVATQESSDGNDFLYSQEYFDYLIECASVERNEKERETAKIELIEENVDEIAYSELFYGDEFITDNFEPFKLNIQMTSTPSAYRETFKKEDSKSIIMLTDKFSIIQDMTTIKNKYNSNDYRTLAGFEYSPFKFFKISSGLETNYRGLDQNPNSRKLYFTPNLYLTDKLSISFYNKMNVTTKAMDHDIGLNISPFEKKFLDFGIYAGATRLQSGAHSESINFRTNFYFF